MVCTISSSRLNGFELCHLENEMVKLTLIPEKGADIYQWIHKPTGVDVMWKSPWGLGRHRHNPSTTSDSQVAWMDGYAGGWQVLFPSGGGPSQYKGVELNFHGEASVSAWDLNEFSSSDSAASIMLSCRLARSPFRIERTITLEAGAMSFLIDETVTNEGGESMDYMWGHHPAYGAPLLSSAARIDTNAGLITFDDTITSNLSPAAPGSSFKWPVVGADEVDLSAVPGSDSERMSMAYLHEFQDETAWYAITNLKLGLGAGLAWSRERFPCAWYWQEMNATAGYPWYKSVYVMAIEPNTSYPGHGLAAMTAASGMQQNLNPGEQASIQLRAVMFESQTGVASISQDGNIQQK